MNLFSLAFIFCLCFLNLLIFLLLGDFGLEFKLEFMPLGLHHFWFFPMFSKLTYSKILRRVHFEGFYRVYVD